MVDHQYGDVFARPSGLELTVRALGVVAAMVTQASAPAQHQLDEAIREALAAGATRQDVVDIMPHGIPFAGSIAVQNGVTAARKAFAS